MLYAKLKSFIIYHYETFFLNSNHYKPAVSAKPLMENRKSTESPGLLPGYLSVLFLFFLVPASSAG